MFCYTGGFSVYAMRGGAASVTSVDSSAKAVTLTDANIDLNFPGDPRHTSKAEDAFKFLADMEKGAYDLIVLDPPAFAKHRSAIPNALRGYQRLNTRAFEKSRPADCCSPSHAPRLSPRSNSVSRSSRQPHGQGDACASSTS